MDHYHNSSPTSSSSKHHDKEKHKKHSDKKHRTKHKEKEKQKSKSKSKLKEKKEYENSKKDRYKKDYSLSERSSKKEQTIKDKDERLGENHQKDSDKKKKRHNESSFKSNEEKTDKSSFKRERVNEIESEIEKPKKQIKLENKFDQEVKKKEEISLDNNMIDTKPRNGESLDDYRNEKEDEDEDRLIEERRKRRQEILAKYQQSQSKDHTHPSSDPSETDSCKLNNETSDISNTHTEVSGIDNSRMAQFQTETDMFSEDSTDVPVDTEVPIISGGQDHHHHQNLNPTLTDNWDDSEGYYRFTIGELLNKRFHITSIHGKGVFSTVLKAKDSKNKNRDVAIKVIRNNDTMYKTGLKEKEMLKKLSENDPDDRRHCIRFICDFEFRNHLCLVLEPMQMNLRDLIKKYGKDEGINLKAVKLYSKQLCVALKHLQRCNIIHADLKPDNIVVNSKMTVLKICDFGSAFGLEDVEITPFLCARFYRAPEIILGLRCDFGIDMWAVGCTLVELYTGKIFFNGKTNNQMLKNYIEWKGKFPKKMLKKGSFRYDHFDDSLHFLSQEEDPVSGKEIVRVLPDLDKCRDFSSVILADNYQPETESNLKELQNFKDFIEQIFILDPTKRMTVIQALQHPFISS